MQFLLCGIDRLLGFPGYVDFVVSSLVGSGGEVAIDPGERRRKIYRRISGGLDQSDIFPSPSADDTVERCFDLEYVDDPLPLWMVSTLEGALPDSYRRKPTYNLIDHDQDPQLRVL
jgi:hypothetical protein